MIAKRTWLQIHKWCGLVIAAFVLVQAATGCVLAYRGELAQMIDPAGMVRRTGAGDAPLSRIVASIRATYPGFELQRIVFPRVERGTYFAHLVNARDVVRYASVDPGDGAVLRAGSIWRFPTEAALLIHYQLLAGRVGLAIVLLTGFSVLSMAVTGLIYWWPRPGRWRTSLNVNWRMPARVVLRQLHRAVGPVIAIAVGLSAITGVVLALGILTRSGPVRSTEPSGMRPVADTNIDQALALARDVFAGRGIRDIRMPAPGKFNVFFWAPENSPEAVHGVRMDLQSLRVVATTRAEADKSLSTFVLPIHSGESLGWAGTLCLFSGALGLMVLAITGPLMWFQARPRRSVRREEARPASRRGFG